MEVYQIVIISIVLIFFAFFVFGIVYSERQKSAPKRLERNIIKAAHKKETYELKEKHRKELERGYR